MMDDGLTLADMRAESWRWPGVPPAMWGAIDAALDRIAQMETALEAHAPNHPLLFKGAADA